LQLLASEHRAFILWQTVPTPLEPPAVSVIELPCNSGNPQPQRSTTAIRKRWHGRCHRSNALKHCRDRQEAISSGFLG
jgi:hypothetical protein